MGIPDSLAIRIIEAVELNSIKGHALMLGRQLLHLNQRESSGAYLQDVLTKYHEGKTVDGLSSEDGYAEKFFLELGFDTIDSMDVSDFEGASIVADLGTGVSQELHERFDYIYDGGTCEHVFELPTALRNIDAMLKPGGIFQAHSPTNNFINHAFFQISPEIVFGFWLKSMGYQLLDVKLVPMQPRYIGQAYSLTNPLETKKRPRIKGKLPPEAPTILDYVVQKPMVPKGAGEKTMQSDYVERWQDDSRNSERD